MRRIRTAVFLMLVQAISLEMACTPSTAFVKAVDGYCDVILPEYEEYVRKDPLLKDSDKEIRLNSSKGLKDLVKEAEKD